MKYILTTYTISEGLYANGYYQMSDENAETVLSWYNDFSNNDKDYWISDDVTLTIENFELVEVEEDSECLTFINKYGNPNNILEHIYELDCIFGSEKHDSTDTDDSDLYTGTETIQQLISAHVKGENDKVQSLLNNGKLDHNDDIINKIISKS